jgi:hypothetical protein
MNISGLEKQRQDAVSQIKMRDKALKLAKNPEFRELILEEYMVQEAARLVSLSADPMFDEKHRADALNMAQAAGHLKRYLDIMVKMGDNAEGTMEDLDTQIEEVRRENAAETSEIDGDATDGEEARGGLQ